MPTRIILPKVGLTVTEGELTRWLVEEGASVSKGQPIAEFEADKASFQIESPGDGVLARIVTPEGRTVVVADLIGWLAEPGESLDGIEESEETGGPPPPGGPAEPAKGSRRVRTSPVARRAARDAGLDLEAIRGSGPGGRIVLSDVEAAVAAASRETRAESTPLAGVRRVIAERMSESHRVTARVTLTTEADATELSRLRDRLAADAERRGDARITYTDLLIKAAALALRRHPALNAKLAGKEIHRLPDVNIGVAVDTDRGLIVPVVPKADQKSVGEIARERRELSERARSGANLPDDTSNGTFTITNLGMFEIDAFTPIINLPECAILGVGRIREKPVAIGGKTAVRPMVWMSLTFDHRLVDGAPAARFLQDVKKLVEGPQELE